MVFFPAGIYRIRTNINVPKNVTLWLIGKFFIDPKVNISISGSLVETTSQIFMGEGSVTLNPGSVKQALPQWWGATGDGTTDDTLAIQKAIDSSKYVFFPSGTYNITSALRVNSGQKLVGANWTNTIINVFNGSNGIEIRSLKAQVADLKIISNMPGTGTGIKIIRSWRCLIDRVWIGDENLYFEKGIEIIGEPSYYNTITRCYLRRNKYGIYLGREGIESGPNETRIINNEILFGDYSVYIDAGGIHQIMATILKTTITGQYMITQV